MNCPLAYISNMVGARAQLCGLADHGPDFTAMFEVGVGSQGASPGDVTVTGWIQVVAGFAEDPARALVAFSQGEEVGGDVLFAPGEALLSGGKLIHERKPKIMLLAVEVVLGDVDDVIMTGIVSDLVTKT